MAHPTMSPEHFGRYLLQVRLASGGMAELFQASLQGEAGFSKQVVVKRILPHLSHDGEFAAMFADEAILAARLHHPNIVQIYDFGQIGTHLYIAMEWVEGFDLYRIQKILQPLQSFWPLPLVATVGAGVAAGLAYVHQAHIIHRDISPHNIMVSPNGAIKITDFGIAKAMARLAKTKTGQLKGKIAYMAPEQIAGDSASPQTDQFSLGVVLWEMLTGRKLFQADSEAALLEQVRRCHVLAPGLLGRKIDEALEHVLLKMLHRDPQQRYQDLGQVAQQLQQIASQLTAQQGSEPPEWTNLGSYIQWLTQQHEHALAHHTPPTHLRQLPITGVGTRKLNLPPMQSLQAQEEGFNATSQEHQPGEWLPKHRRQPLEGARKKTRRLSVRPTLLTTRQLRYAGRHPGKAQLWRLGFSLVPWLLLVGFAGVLAYAWSGQLIPSPNPSPQQPVASQQPLVTKPIQDLHAPVHPKERPYDVATRTPMELAQEGQLTGQVWLESPGQTLTVHHDNKLLGTTPLQGVELPAGLIELHMINTATSANQQIWLLVPQQGKVTASIQVW